MQGRGLNVKIKNARLPKFQVSGNLLHLPTPYLYVHSCLYMYMTCACSLLCVAFRSSHNHPRTTHALPAPSSSSLHRPHAAACQLETEFRILRVPQAPPSRRPAVTRLASTLLTTMDCFRLPPRADPNKMRKLRWGADLS